MKFFREVRMDDITDENVKKWTDDGFEIRYGQNTLELWYEDKLAELAA